VTECWRHPGSGPAHVWVGYCGGSQGSRFKIRSR
jgi:hypothetical protein